MNRGRLESLDAFRGLTIAGMILVNNPGSWAHVYPPLLHAPWHGWTPTDLIFPFFLFIVGVAMPFSFAGRLRRGADRGDLMAHVAQRSAILVLIGLAMAAVPRFDFANLRIPGVLQRIGIVYLLAAPAYLFLGRQTRVLLTAAVLLGYWAVMALWPVPGYGAGLLTQDGNPAAWLDRLLLDGHLWSQSRTWDPEGILSTVPAVATCLLGVFTGELLGGAPGHPAQDSAPGGGAAHVAHPATASTSATLARWGLALGAAGLVWHVWFPINKNLWTSSYVLFTAGAAMVLLASFHWIMDVRGARRWATPFLIYGRNALAVFVASGMVAKALILSPAPGGAAQSGESGAAIATSMYDWIYQNVFAPVASPVNASLLFALATVVLWGGVLFWMDRKRIYIKV